MLLLALLLTFSTMAVAEGAAEASPPPEIENEDGARTAESLEGEVTIVQGRNAIFEEYRRNGRLFMVKVIPNVGPPYYLIDSDGDGMLEFQGDDISGNWLIPQWVLFSW
jgi:hypothetical protein